MSLSSPATNDELKEYCLRQLGKPVIKINVDDTQVNDAITNAFQFWNEFHFDGTVRTYLKYQMTADDITNNNVTLSPGVIGVIRVFPVGGTQLAMSFFDLRYQLRLNDLWDLSSTSYTNYTLTMQHLRTLDLIFSGEQPVRFNALTNMLYIDWDWNNDIAAGEWIIVECNVVTDPGAYSAVYNDRMLKKLATAYLKKQWGSNLKKYGNTQTIGGITFNGQVIYEEAMKEIEETENSIKTEFQEPPQMLVG